MSKIKLFIDNFKDVLNRIIAIFNTGNCENQNIIAYFAL